MSKKIIASIVALIMLATGVCVFTSTDDSDASVGIDTVNVYYQTLDQNNQLVWNCTAVEKFNLYEALVAVLPSTYSLTADSSWTVTSAIAGTYPSETYGTVSAVTYNNTNYTSTFAIKVCNAGDNTWTDVTDYPLGWFRPFTDYDAYVDMVQVNNGDNVGSAYANIAISLVSNAEPSASILSTTPLRSLTNPAGLSSFLYTFVIRDATNSLSLSSVQGKQFVGGDYELRTLDMSNVATTGVTIYGYGSDAYLALLDATGGVSTQELLGQEDTWINHGTYLTQYSWMYSLFGYGTQYGGEEDEWSYKYWSTYQRMNGNDAYAMFNLGYHTTVSGSYSFDFGYTDYYCTGNQFLLQYEVS